MRLIDLGWALSAHDGETTWFRAGSDPSEVLSRLPLIGDAAHALRDLLLIVEEIGEVVAEYY